VVGSGCCRPVGSHISRSDPQTIAITNNTIANKRVGARGVAVSPWTTRAFVGHRRQHGGQEPDDRECRHQRRKTPRRPACRPRPTVIRCKPGCATPNLFPNSGTLGTTLFSKPVVFDDVFWDNRAGNFSGGWVYGIGGHAARRIAERREQLGHGPWWDVPGALLTPTHTGPAGRDRGYRRRDETAR